MAAHGVLDNCLEPPLLAHFGVAASETSLNGYAGELPRQRSVGLPVVIASFLPCAFVARQVRRPALSIQNRRSRKIFLCIWDALLHHQQERRRRFVRQHLDLV